VDSPSLVPFHLRPVHAETILAACSRLNILRHGMDDDLVMLCKHKEATAEKEVDNELPFRL
jgi:hypothetical protein